MRHQPNDNPRGGMPSDWKGLGIHTDKVEAWEITPLELKQRLDRGEPVVLIDVREPWEAEVATLPGSRALPLNELRYRAEEELEFDDDVVLYCHHGVRSLEAARVLWDFGYTQVKSLAGGIHRWSLQVDSDVAQY